MEVPAHEYFGLRQQASYWRTAHARAKKRESEWKVKAAEFEWVARTLKAELVASAAELEVLKARTAWLEQQLFGSKGEQSVDLGAVLGGDGQSANMSLNPGTSGVGRKRGQQPGRKSTGRRGHPELPTEEIAHDLCESERRCPKCGAPFPDFPGTEDSEEIHWEVRMVRRVHRRTRYRRTCNCPDVPGIVTAPIPPKLIPKGKFTTEFWVRILEQKYRFQIPLHRTLRMLEAEGLRVAQGTLTDGLQRIAKLIEPLYASMLEHSRGADHWHMDETRWRVFEDVEGKKGHRWWLWIVVTHDTCVFLLDPTRSGDVPKKFLGDTPAGVISADRYSAYKPLLSTLLFIAYCWAHVRRDFCRIRDGHPKLQDWATAWIERINRLFHTNSQRIEALSDPKAFCEHHRALREQMEAMARLRDVELVDKTLHGVAYKALDSMARHWEGLSIFVDNSAIPMDNNRAERGIRNPVVGRKNYYGSGSIWSGMLSVMLFSLFQTLEMNHIDPHAFLLSYFDACAQNRGHPPDNLDTFVPWRVHQEDEEAA